MKTPAAVAAALAALVLPPPAAAHLVLEFDPQTARRGETVTVGLADAHDLAVDVYLVPLEAAREFEPPPSQAPVDLVPIGRLGAGGRLAFVVPDLPPGRYTTVLRRADGRYLASTQPQLPPGVDPAGFQEAPDPAIIRIRGEARDTALLLAALGLLFIGVLFAAAVVARRRWRDAVSG